MPRTEQEVRHIRKPKKGETKPLSLIDRSTTAIHLLEEFMSSARKVPEFAYAEESVTALFSYRDGVEKKHGQIDLRPYRWDITYFGGVTTEHEAQTQLVVKRNTLGPLLVPRKSWGVLGWDEHLIIEHAADTQRVRHASILIETEWLDQRFTSLGSDDRYASRIGEYMLEDFQNGVDALYNQPLEEDALRLQAERIADLIKAKIPEYKDGYAITQTDKTTMHERWEEKNYAGKVLYFSERTHQSGDRFYTAEIADDLEKLEYDMDEDPNIRRDIIEVFIPTQQTLYEKDQRETWVRVDSLHGDNIVFMADESNPAVVLRAVENRFQFIDDLYHSQQRRKTVSHL
jgi:hypothetical protein